MTDNKDKKPDDNKQTENQTDKPKTPETTVDYDKIQQMIDASIQTAFSGLSTDSNEPQQPEPDGTSQGDIDALTKENAELKAKILNSDIQNEARKAALDSGIDLKNIDYMLKLAELTGVTDENGGILQDKVKEAVEKVLADFPMLKTGENSQGFVTVGADGQGSGKTEAEEREEHLKKIMKLK